MFAVQHQGWCASTKYAYRTYGRYGRSNRCRNGKGGPWANDVYVLRGKKTIYIFCRKVILTLTVRSRVLIDTGELLGQPDRNASGNL